MPGGRAQWWLRRCHGADDSAPLLTSPEGRSYAGHTFADVLTRVRTDTEPAVTSRRVAGDRPVGSQWTTRWGISLQDLTNRGSR